MSRQDPTRLASASDDGTVRIWSISHEASVATIPCGANVCSVQWNPGSAHLLALGAANCWAAVYDVRHLAKPLCQVRAVFGGGKGGGHEGEARRRRTHEEGSEAGRRRQERGGQGASKPGGGGGGGGRRDEAWVAGGEAEPARVLRALCCAQVAHSKAVSYVRHLPGGSELLTGSTDNAVRRWELPAVQRVLSGGAASGGGAAAAAGDAAGTAAAEGLLGGGRRVSSSDGRGAGSGGVGAPRCSMVYRGHLNERNFVGLSVSSEGYVACGSEDNSVVCYHQVSVGVWGGRLVVAA